MNKLFFTGRVVSRPVTNNYDKVTITKFRLIKEEYAGCKDGKTIKRQTVIPFTLFSPLAERLSKHITVGDQLIVEAKIRNNRYTDKDGVEQFDYTFEVLGFTFGAPGKEKREKFAQKEKTQEDQEKDQIELRNKSFKGFTYDPDGIDDEEFIE